MSGYRGNQELHDYVKNKVVPLFNDFIADNKLNMIQWTDYREHLTPIVLYKIWRGRFVMELRDQKKLEKIIEGKGTFSRTTWLEIINGAKALHNAEALSTTDSIGTAAIAIPAATNMIAESNNTSAATSSTAITNGSGELNIQDISQDDHELKFHLLAHKKYSTNETLSDSEVEYLSNYQSNGSPKEDLLCICAPLLIKADNLTHEEDALLELSLSGIYNYLNPYMKKVYREKLGRSPPTITSTTTTATSVTSAMDIIHSVLAKSEDIDELLLSIQVEKTILLQERMRHTDSYKALAIVEKMIEDSQLWSEAGDEQEMTFYRRFAGYLDVLLSNTDLKIIDGETGCASSRVIIETNKQLFNADDSSTTYARKIDLILRYNDRKSIDLCTNEWKKSKVPTDLKLKQQSKNMRVNASVLNSIQATNNVSLNSILALDMIGLHGYIYQLTKVEDYFVAVPHSILALPRRFADIVCVEDTLLALFSFKQFYVSAIPTLRRAIAKNEVRGNIESICELPAVVAASTNVVEQNLIFFKSRKRKQSTGDSRDDD